MSETGKTLAFVAAAAMSLFMGFAMGPRETVFNAEELVGQRLNEFEVDAPKRLKIVKFDSDTATAHEFEVAEDQGLWSIPSKNGYPADATKQMAEAATCLMDREVLRVASTSASQHEALGVIDPSSSKLNSQAQGVGTRVVLSDGSNKMLTDMIIGKPVKDAEGQYYLRNTDQDIVYVVRLDPEKLSTRFEDWIEADLLQINPLDLQRIEIKDYSAEVLLSQSGIQIDWDRRAELTFKYDTTNSKWLAESLKKFDKDKKEYADYQLSDKEELNEEILGKLRDGLDDLKIVDVERKPTGLSANLKAGADFVKDIEAVTSLIQRGFAPLSIGPDKEADILSTEGEVICSLQDGIEYVLRFGNLQMEGEDGKSQPVEAPVGDAKSGDDIHRYMFVMARFNEALIEKPELDDLPELPEGSDEEATQDGEDASASGDEDQTKEEDEDAKPQADEDDAKAKELADIIEARKSIETENQRRLDEYQGKLKKSQDRVQELNGRFGDWYYVISNEVYQQVHLGLDKVAKKKEAEKDAKAEGADAGEPAATGLPNLPFGGAPEK